MTQKIEPVFTEKALIAKIKKLTGERKKYVIEEGFNSESIEREEFDITGVMNAPTINNLNNLLNSYDQKFDVYKLKEEDYYKTLEDMTDCADEIEYDVLFNLYSFLDELKHV